MDFFGFSKSFLEVWVGVLFCFGRKLSIPTPVCESLIEIAGGFLDQKGRKMRVFNAVHSIAPLTGGPARSSQGFVTGLSASAVDAWLVTFCLNEQPWYPNVQHHLQPRVAGYLNKKQFFKEAIQKICPDVIQCNGIWEPHTHIIIQEAAAAGIPCIVAGRGNFSEWAMSRSKTKKWFAWWLYQRWDLKKATAFHATSQMEADYIRKLGFQQPIIVVPNGVDIPDDRVMLQCEAIRERSAAAANRTRRILFFARIHFQKGLRELLNAWALLHQNGDTNGWVLEIIGPDMAGHRDALVCQCQSSGLSVCLDKEAFPFSVLNGVVHFRGEMPDVLFSGEVPDSQKWICYAGSDISILPSYTENFGLSIAESLWMGVPVIATRDRTPWAELEEEDCGHWVELSVNVLAETLREMMSLSDEERLKMGLRGNRLIARKYTWSTVAKKMIAAYEWVLNGGAPPDYVIVK